MQLRNIKFQYDEERSRESKEHEEKISLLLHQLRGMECESMLSSITVGKRYVYLYVFRWR